MPSHTALARVAAFGILMYALVPSGGGAARASEPRGPAPAVLASVTTSPLTPAVLRKILGIVASRGTDRKFNSRVANALGLGAAGQTLPVRQAVIAERGADVRHGFAVSLGSDQDILISRRLPDAVHFFRAHRDGTVVTALISDLETGRISMRVPSEAQSELDAEFAFWAGVSPNGSAGGK